MTFTGRIRIYLILAALIPPLLIMSVIYFHSARQVEISEQQTISRHLDQYRHFMQSYRIELGGRIAGLAETEPIRKAAIMIKSNRASKINISSNPGAFDFLEILDSSHTVLASAGRPGLIGQRILKKISVDSGTVETTEYDMHGRHAAMAFLFPVAKNVILYAGLHIDSDLLGMIGGMVPGTVNLYYADADLPDGLGLENMEQDKLYEKDSQYYILLAGSESAGYYLLARPDISSGQPVLSSIILVTGIVALLAVLVAVLLGMYITGRAKREIDNLMTATARVARGDFTTPVMAYEEGEFSHLADSISTMMNNLRHLQHELAMTEKIAAWKTMGQKVAHEIKNPLTPIEISVDDLRRSYQDKLPGFDRTLDETTATIKNEIRRLIKLLDQFVSFARMSAPVIKENSLVNLIEDFAKLHHREIEQGHLVIRNDSRKKSFPFDPEAIKQVLINLIKNSRETSPDTIVEMTFSDTPDGLSIRIEDNGPGFDNKILDKKFEPYVSTKKDGSGLGLVICQRIVHDHSGKIEIYNRPEGGAGVHIELPGNHG